MVISAKGAMSGDFWQRIGVFVHGSMQSVPFFPQGFCDEASGQYSSISSTSTSKSPHSPFSSFFLTSQGPILLILPLNDSHVIFFWRCWLVMGRWPQCPRHLSHHRRQRPNQPNQPDTCEDIKGGERFMCEYPSIKIFNMGAASPLLQHASLNQAAKQKMDNEALDLTLDVTKWS